MRFVAWMRKNLFDGWWNTLLTLSVGGLLIAFLRSVSIWAFTEARWYVIPNNFRLLMVGPYPPEEVWRLWVALTITTGLMGLSFGVFVRWWGPALSRALALALLIWVLAWPVVMPGTRLWLFLALVTFFAAYPLGTRLAGLRKFLPVMWLLAFLLALDVASGVPMNRWGGFFLTMVVTVSTVVIAFPLGLILALGRTSKMPVISLLSTLYIELIRGVPLVTVLFLAWIMVPLFVPENLRVPQMIRAIAGFALFAAAYLAEYVRGGLQGVPKGQWEAAWAVGLSGYQTVTYIILPQAIRSVIPALIGQAIAIFKDTSLLVIIGLFDLLSMAQVALSNPKYLGLEREVYLFLMLVYFIGAAVLSYASRRVEKAMGLGSR